MEGLKPSEGHQQCGTGTLNFTWPKPNVERFGLERRWQVLFSLLILCCEPRKCVSISLQYRVMTVRPMDETRSTGLHSCQEG